MLKIRIFCGDGITSTRVGMLLREAMRKRNLEADIEACSYVFAPDEAPGSDAILIAKDIAVLRPEIVMYAEGAPVEVLDVRLDEEDVSEEIMDQVMRMVHKHAV